MRRLARLLLLVAVGTVGLLVLPSAAGAQTPPERTIFNLRALGSSPNPLTYTETGANSDLAFWGNTAINGSYKGFRIIDISDRQNPQEIINYEDCSPTPPGFGNQGDIVIWEDILVRAWNSPAAEGATCDGQEVDPGFEGVHVFDISNPQDPALIGEVELPCGSHTLTAVPDVEAGRLLVYNHTSGGPCFFFDMLEVPLDAPEDTHLLRQIPLETEGACHDSGVILGDVNLMACASHHEANVYDIGANQFEGGSIDRPKFMYKIAEPGVGDDPDHPGNWHSAGFTWDGKVLILGWEPGGGADPECEATDPVTTKSAFFYNAKTGDKLGQWTLPRSQTAEENCTIHNYNVVPIEGRYILTSGNYQAGTWVTDFTNPAEPFVRGFADPDPLVPTQLGGAWSSYWYNRNIYESSITEGLNIWRLRDPEIRQDSMRLRHLNPQTQEFSLP
jgi:LVIVD repeat